MEIYTFNFCLDTYKNGIDILSSKNYNNIENINFILNEEFYLDGNSKNETPSDKLNKFRKIFENKTNFLLSIRDFFSKQIKKTIYFLFFENFFSEFENYHKMIQTKEFVKKMCSEKQTAQAEIINKIINIFDIKPLFPILINKTSFDDLIKIFVAFFVLKEFQVSEPIMSDSFDFVKKVLEKQNSIFELEHLITEEVIQNLEYEMDRISLSDFYNQIFFDLKQTLDNITNDFLQFLLLNEFDYYNKIIITTNLY